MPAGKTTDAIALLKADHREVEGFFDSYQRAKSPERKRALAEQICLELTVHTKVEGRRFLSGLPRRWGRRRHDGRGL